MYLTDVTREPVGCLQPRIVFGGEEVQNVPVALMSITHLMYSGQRLDA